MIDLYIYISHSNPVDTELLAFLLLRQDQLSITIIRA